MERIPQELLLQMIGRRDVDIEILQARIGILEKEIQKLKEESGEDTTLLTPVQD